MSHYFGTGCTYIKIFSLFKLFKNLSKRYFELLGFFYFSSIYGNISGMNVCAHQCDVSCVKFGGSKSNRYPFTGEICESTLVIWRGRRDSSAEPRRITLVAAEQLIETCVKCRTWLDVNMGSRDRRSNITVCGGDG